MVGLSDRSKAVSHRTVAVTALQLSVVECSGSGWKSTIRKLSRVDEKKPLGQLLMIRMEKYHSKTFPGGLKETTRIVFWNGWEKKTIRNPARKALTKQISKPVSCKRFKPNLWFAGYARCQDVPSVFNVNGRWLDVGTIPPRGVPFPCPKVPEQPLPSQGRERRRRGAARPPLSAASP